MKTIMILLLVIFLYSGALSCSRATEPLCVLIPEGLIVTTDAQKEFLANLKKLTRGMSLEDSKQHLGIPTEETSNSLFYIFIEDRIEGGYYLPAALTFDGIGLTNVKIGFGHESRSHRIQE